MDPVPLQYIRQIPGVTGVVSSLLDLPAGEVWPEERIRALTDEVRDAGLTLEVIESVNVHEDIKLGLPSRDQYIENYIATVERLGRAGIRVICYNFMPVLDWVRTDLAYRLPDGSETMRYLESAMDGVTDLEAFADAFVRSGKGFALAGWEPERMATLAEKAKRYAGMTHEDLFRNLCYFLKAVLPACERAGIRMAIHPDDPPWDLFGLPRIANSPAALERIVRETDHPCNAVTLCTGSLGADPGNDVIRAIRTLGGLDRIAFAHLRNLRFLPEGGFYESAHLSEAGSLDMAEIVRALRASGFDGYIRPDHGRMIFGETGRPGYGLYDRALGAAYLLGLWEACGSR